MGYFQPRRTGGFNVQSGMVAPGDGDQLTGGPSRLYGTDFRVLQEPVRPTKGKRSWMHPAAGAGAQRGYPSPEALPQRRPANSMPNRPLPFGTAAYVETPYYSRGMNAYVPNMGITLTNPIGAGIVAMERPKPSYGPAATYANGALWWTSQVVPTTIGLQALNSPAQLEALLSQTTIEAVVRTTG